MPERLTPLEVSLLARDTVRTPAHLGGMHVFEGAVGLDHERLVALVGDRLSYVPRYRQRVRFPPGGLGGPVWVDDEDFDLTFHVRRSVLPGPGTDQQLRELVARVLTRRLDRRRPLWELHLVLGLADDRFALVSKSHLSLVDGLDTVDLVQVLLDSRPDQHVAAAAAWHPRPEPSSLELLGGALWRGVRDPALEAEVALANVRRVVAETRDVAAGIGAGLGGLTGADSAAGVEATHPGARSPLVGAVSPERRVGLVAVPLAELQVVRTRHAVAVHDVVLALVTGGLRAWLLSRGQSPAPGATVTALVPMSVAQDEGEPTALGLRVVPRLVRLPVGEPDPVLRLRQLAYGTRAHRERGDAVAGRSLADLAGFAPPTLHGLGARAAAGPGGSAADLLLTDAPGPQLPLYAAAARLLDSYPVPPLSPGRRLSVGATSYAGQVFVGLAADAEAVPDFDGLASGVERALAELRRRRNRTGRSWPAGTADTGGQAIRRSAARRQPVRRKVGPSPASSIGGRVPRVAGTGPEGTGPANPGGHPR